MTDEYRLLVTGSRWLSDRTQLREQLGYRLDHAIAEDKRLVIVHGHNTDQSGADRTADAWGEEQARQGMPVRVEKHPAQNHPTQDFGPWPGAGPTRNQFMVDQGADECLAVIDRCTSIRCRRPDVHASHGATDCAKRAEAAGIRVERIELWTS